MHVLSASQPFAQLLVRGVKRLEVRTWEPTFTLPARVAIHASVRAPNKLDTEDWFGQREEALAFAEQGWVNRDDLTALPRRAIVGTATLIAVHLGADVHSGKAEIFAWNHETERMEVGERDPETGALRETGETGKLKPLGVSLAKTAYAWVFADPLEFEPIIGVDGKLRTWQAAGEIETLIGERERQAQKKLWRPAAVSQSKKAKAVLHWQERWTSMRDYLLEEVESDVRRKREIRSLVFSRKVEAKLREDLKQYAARNPHPRRKEWVHVEEQFRPMFEGLEWIPFEWFELFIRRRVKGESDAQMEAQRRAERTEALGKIVDDAGSKALQHYAKREALVEKLEKALDRMLEQEAMDAEFAKRELNPKFEGRMERARLRRMTRHPKDPNFDYTLWQPMIEKLIRRGLSDDEVAVAMAWEQLKTELLLEGEG